MSPFPLEVANAKANGGTMLNKQPDGSLLAAGNNPTPGKYTVVATTPVTGITAIRLEALPDPSLPANGPGRAPNGNFVLNEFRLTAAPQGEPMKATAALFSKAVASFSQESYGVALAIDGNAGTGWAVAPQFGKAHVALFHLQEPLAFPDGARLTFTLDQQFPGKDHNLGRFRLAVTTAPNPVLTDSLPPQVVQALAVPPEKRSNEQQAALLNYYRSQDGELVRLSRAVAQSPRPGDKRLIGAQDLAWALLNSPAFLFNH